ncbi:MAG: hypothetical protein ACI9E4_000907 [Pseudohongiellaceae bacterium]|jgi:hypothetical protein
MNLREDKRQNKRELLALQKREIDVILRDLTNTEIISRDALPAASKLHKAAS